MTESQSPVKVTSKRRVEYRKSGWKVHDFEVWSGEKICKVATICMGGSLLVWVGGEQAKLSEMALGMPAQRSEDALGTTLFGKEHNVTSLACRLATRLSKPVYVGSGLVFDRFTAPLVEKGIALEIKQHPEYFT
ncbi:unnamed protein product [Leptosia nina]|uniref:Uncharacterized protein n=1 Tax=Leptosia nina TaxID=320188 RepID=A0AAV1JT92_9NEOP